MKIKTTKPVRLFCCAIAGMALLSMGATFPVQDPVEGVVVGGGTLFLDADDSTVADWGITGGESFSIFDITNSSLPFSLEEGAANGSLLVNANGDILMAGGAASVATTTEPDAGLHILRDDMSTGLSGIKVEDAGSEVVNRDLMQLVNNGGVRFALDNLDRNERWEFSNNTVGDFNITRSGTGGSELAVSRAGRVIMGPGGFAAFDARPNGNVFIAGTLSESSDRDKKENFEDVDCEAILKQVADLSITTWNYKTDEEDIRHMGPVAQDFRGAFKLGDSDKTIATTDKVGVSLAAIKALNTKLKGKDVEIKSLRSELEEVNERMERLETMLEQALLAQ